MHMPNRTAKFASAIVASLLASAALAAESQSATPAADDCLTAPKEQTPQGSHWYYRLEHGTKRHCWYLRAEGDARSQATSPNSTVSAKPVAPKMETATQGSAMQGSVANARAELRAPQTRSEPDTNVATTGQLPSAAAASTTSTDNNQRATGQDASMLQTAVASRWPSQLSASSSAASASDDASASDEANSNTPAQLSETTAPPSATVPTAPVTLAAADTSSEKQSGSVPMLLIIMTGALAIAGLVGGAVIKFSGMRRDDSRDEDSDDEDYAKIQRDRRSTWNLERTERARSRPFPASAAQRPNIGIPRELRTADGPDDQIREMLARLARSAQT
jgi:hypothetical protein